MTIPVPIRPGAAVSVPQLNASVTINLPTLLRSVQVALAFLQAQQIEALK
jgi:hypothetical protein